MTETIEIVCGIDANYAPHLAVMLKSLASCNRKNNFRIHILHDNVPDELRKRVEECNKELEINWINAFNNPVLDIEGVGHISRAAYLRLMMLEVLDPALKRVLYLDADIVINGDLSTLWNTSLGNKVCGAVVDAWISSIEFAKKWNLPGEPAYFNSGVILFDLEKLRSKPYMEQAIKRAATDHQGSLYVDQDALNYVLWNNWLAVDPVWNFQRGYLYDHHNWEALSSQKYQPAIIHFTEAFKPWKKNEWHPCQWLYLRMLLKTSFKDQALKAEGVNFYHFCKAWLKWNLKRPSMFRQPII